MAAIRADFAAARAGEEATAEAIATTLARSGYLLDPHSAVGVSVARRLREAETPMVTLATAHPSKFPAAVKQAAGVEPALPLWLADLYQKPERVSVLDNDQAAVEEFILAATRA